MQRRRRAFPTDLTDAQGAAIAGRKPHILTDTDGLLVAVQVLAGRVQDRDGAKPLLRASRSLWACLETVFADGGYAGGLIAWAMRPTNLVLCIVERAHALLRFGPLPPRRVIERRFGWRMTNRRPVLDVEQRIDAAEALMRAAGTATMLRRIA